MISTSCRSAGIKIAALIATDFFAGVTRLAGSRRTGAKKNLTRRIQLDTFAATIQQNSKGRRRGTVFFGQLLLLRVLF